MNIKITKLLSRFSTVAVLLALIVVSIFQYNWVISSAETNVVELHRSIIFSIDNKLLQEFNNLPIIKNKPQFTTKNITASKIIQELDTAKENQYILSIGLVQTNNQVIYSEHSTSDWGISSNSPLDLDDIIDLFNQSEFKQDFIYPDSINQGIIWLAYPIFKSSDSFILFKLDIESLYRDKIEEYSNDFITDYTVSFLNELPADVNILERERYSFSIFNRERWISEIPYNFTLLPNKQPPNKQSPNNQPPPPRDMSKRPSPPRSNPLGDVQNRDSFFYLEILSNDESLISKKENSYTFQWLMILILLISIGLAYILIITQIGKLKKIRQREKEFVASITHELRTPLMVIQAAAENIEAGILNRDKILQYCKLIGNQSSRLSSMIEGILLFSKLEGRTETPPELKDITSSELSKSIIIFCDSLMQQSKNSIKVDFSKLPETFLSDRESVELILTNLISNCNKHAYITGEPGIINIKAFIEHDKSIIFNVEDNGIGIEKSERVAIFEPFYRGKLSLKKQVKGTGLGLFISFKKAKLISGNLRVDNKKDGGAIFTLQIPYRERELYEKSTNNRR